jgi:hypothetical protein
MKLEKFEIEDENWSSYGFMVYNRSGYSLPKGMISSFKAQQFSDKSVEIEYSIQSPSGFSPDSSDHLTYTMPAISSFSQAKKIVDMYADMVEFHIASIQIPFEAI